MEDSVSKKKRAKKAQKWLIGTLIVGMIGAGFYWVSVRPVQVRKYCSNKAYELATKKDYDQASRYRTLYEQCLHNRGI